MVTETQDSPAVVEQPQGKPSEVAQAPQEKGSEAPKPVVGVGEVGKAASLDFEKLWKEDPSFRSYVERQAQSRLDKALPKTLAQQRAQWEAQQAQTEGRRRQEEALKAELAMDEFALGEKRKKEIEQILNPDPRVNQAYSVALTEGERRAFVRMSQALDANPDWRDLSAAERQEIVDSSSDVTEVVAKVIEIGADRRATKKLQTELDKYKAKVEAEQKEEARATEPSPDTGAGSPSSSDDAFIAAYARGEPMSPAQHARALKLLNLAR